MTSQPAHPLEYIFHPRSIAACGSFTHPFRWWLREYYIDPFINGGFPGQLYLVDARGGQLSGLPIYRSLGEIPGPVDYVICSVAAENTPTLLEECRDVGTKVVQIFTAGFAETGDPERVALQEKLVDIAHSSGIRIIGPNCMGVYYPRGGLSFSLGFTTEPGSIGLLCQSGGMTTYITRLATHRGLRFSKVVSYGNACDINECDLLEYMTVDPETRVIAAYIEGASDGARLVESLTRAAATKPVVVFKGGYTEGGARATASHTGALAGSDMTWEGLLRQAGAIRVHSGEEMVDMLMALTRVRPPEGRNVCVVGNGGGSSVLATDQCEQAGLRMASMPVEIRNRLRSFLTPVGTMLRNPIDCVWLIPTQQDGTFLGKAVPSWEGLVKDLEVKRGDGAWGDFLGTIEEWGQIDLMLFQYSIDINPFIMTEWRIGTAVGFMVAAARACRLPKAIVVHLQAEEDSVPAYLAALRECREAGLPLFLTLHGAARAIHRLIDYHREHPGMLGRVQGVSD